MPHNLKKKVPRKKRPEGIFSNIRTACSMLSWCAAIRSDLRGKNGLRIDYIYSGRNTYVPAHYVIPWLWLCFPCGITDDRVSCFFLCRLWKRAQTLAARLTSVSVIQFNYCCALTCTVPQLRPVQSSTCIHDKKTKLPPQYYCSQIQLRAWPIIYASATPLNPHLPVMTVKYQHALHLLNLCASQTSWAVQPVSHYCYTYIILYVLQDFGPRSRKNFGSTKHAFGTECTLYLAALVVCPGGDLRRKAAETTRISWQPVSPHPSIILLNCYKELRMRPALAGTHSPLKGEGV